MKLYYFIILMIGLVFLINISGLEIDGLKEVNDLVQLKEGSISNSTIYTKIFGAAGILTLIAGAGAVSLGFFGRTLPENYILVPFIISVASPFVGVFQSIINYTQGNPDPFAYILLAIFSVLGVGFIISLAEFFRGTD